MCIFRATVSAVSCLVVPGVIYVDLLISCALKINDDADDDDDDDDNCRRLCCVDLATARTAVVVSPRHQCVTPNH